MAKLKGKEKTSFLPQGVAESLKHRGLEGIGILLIAAALVYAASLVTYSPSDPSLNRATGGEISNILGLSGAITADLMLQTLGLGSAMLVPILAAWGWRFVADHALSLPWVRLALAPLVLLIGSVAFAGFAVFDSWPLDPGLGGITGDFMMKALVQNIPQGLPLHYGIGFSFAGLALLLYVMGIPAREWLAGFKSLLGLGRHARVAVEQAGHMRHKVSDAAQAAVARVKGERMEPTLSAPSKRRDKVVQEPPEPRPVKKDRIATPEEKPKPGKRVVAEKQIKLDLPTDGEYQLPPLDLLDDYSDHPSKTSHDKDSLEQNARLLEGVLEDFGVKGEIVKVRPGPVVTLYELEPAPGTKTSRVIGLSDDIARSMSAISVRIATVPGRSVIGIEMPNADREMVHLRELLASSNYEKSKDKLPMVLGKDIGGGPVIADLATMPHLLVAGTTGSGKSVGLNAMILSLLYKLPPERCKFIMIDPKMLELSVYDDIPHLLAPVVTDPKKAVVALKWTVREMENRYRAMSKLSVRNIEGYNKRVTEAARKGEEINRQVQTGFDPETGEAIFEEEPLDLTPLPYIVVIVDEMADLMLVAGKDIEASIQRLAQMARAAGIHIIMATQRPSVDVITGTIKANFPTRISFMVTSKVDSRTILGEQGAEQLLGRGDMLHMAGGGRVARVHGPFVDDAEVEEVCNFLKAQSAPQYLDSVTDENDMSGGFENRRFRGRRAAGCWRQRRRAL